MKSLVITGDIAKQAAIRHIQQSPIGYVFTLKEPTRNLEQNAAQWPILQSFSEQLPWPVNGQMVKLSDEERKDLLTAAFRQEQPRVATGINGGVVMLGHRTSKFSKREFSDWLEFLHAVAIDRGVVVCADRAA